jgi:hypothetical protein
MILGARIRSFRTFWLGVAAFTPFATVRSVEPRTVVDSLYQTIQWRVGPDGNTYGHDETDLLFWDGTSYFSSAEYRVRLLAALNAVQQLPDSDVDRCPATQRALVQNRVWALFDHLQKQQTWRSPSGENRRLSQALAATMAKLALDDPEIAAIADPLLEAAQSGRWPPDPQTPGGPAIFLPPGLASDDGPWTSLGRDGWEVAAKVHVQGFGGRSAFLVKARMPGETGDLARYFQAVADFPRPWLPNPDGFVPPGAPSLVKLNPELPALPRGIEFALIRRVAVVDRQGHWHATPLTLSVQVRRYRATTADDIRPMFSGTDSIGAAQAAQSVAEFELMSDQAAAGGPALLRPVVPKEKHYLFFQDQGGDEVDGTNFGHPADRFFSGAPNFITLNSCFSCHQPLGLASVNIAVGLDAPPFVGKRLPHLTPTSFAAESALDEQWKEAQSEWHVLLTFWPIAANSR